MLPVQRDELRDELVVLLGASRELPPETDRYLVESLLNRLEQQAAPRRQRTRTRRRRTRDPRRAVGALLFAALALAIGTPISLHANGAAPASSAPAGIQCPSVQATFPSQLAYHQALKGWRNLGYRAGGTWSRSDGSIGVVFTHAHCP